MLTRWLNDYQQALSPASNPVRAASMAAYMKHHFVFLGIPTPERRKLVAHIEQTAKQELSAAQLLALAALLYQQAAREYHYCALDLLVRCQHKLTATNLASLEMLITTHSWWDSVDVLAVKLVGALVKREPSLLSVMDAWAQHPNLWLRRTAILLQLSWKHDTDAKRLFAYCLLNTAEPDFFIRKAIGWALRQYARVAPQTVLEFVTTHQQLLAPLSVNEALKHLRNAANTTA
ncbi:DNA alkylation repair protein [Chitinibacter fontanus]|uniref:DNA alkylation repair protein n=1 Tax=Chitinibacter fontanus TaxID=1737446 RepID=A0A7D5ZFZ6_9NEIS|nr:DNA alkylation repair protein [Chitinibacter fontanus]QLI81127.1 DNA alkylation repair protein [Chitinibacter fontanus]